MGTSRQYTDLNIRMMNAFAAYLKKECPFYQGFSNESTSDVTVYLTEDINDARGQFLDNLVYAYSDPDVYWNQQYNKTQLTPSETVVDGTDSGLFTPLTTTLLVNYGDDNIVNSADVYVQSQNIDGPSEKDPQVTVKLRDLTSSRDMGLVARTPSGPSASDGSTVTKLTFEDIAQYMPDSQSLLEISVAIQGNLAVKANMIQYWYSVKELPS